MTVVIFGFGSIIFKQNFAYTDSFACYVKGWERVFWQGSTDHRGVPGAPGRTATMVPREGSRCWGKAFVIDVAPEEEAGYLAELEVREKQYDRRELLDVFTDDEGAEPVRKGVLAYVATERSDNWLGPAPLEDIAETIATARGPSGPNAEYLLRLADHLRLLGVTERDDPHVFDLERLVLARLGRESPAPALQ